MNGLDNQQATVEELAWLGGILDGEGYLTLAWRHQQEVARGERQNRNVVAEITVSNTDPAIILKVQTLFRKLDAEPRVRSWMPKNGNHEAFACEIHRFTKAKRILEAVFPYLTGNKKARAELMLQFIGAREGKRNQPYSPEELDLVTRVHTLIGMTKHPRQSPQRPYVEPVSTG